jgi:BirA family biotin operon repressor/biotin-[acetyl-CoA-carboxylase] ligase
VVLQPLKLAPSQPFRLSATIATAVHDMLQKEWPQGWRIKWPNDLYWNDRKAGGILIENVIQSGKWMWAVAGIGLNVNSRQFDPALPNPTSLSLVTGHAYEVEDLARRLCSYIDHRFRQLMAGGWSHILADYNRALYKTGEYQKLKQGSAVASYLINRVDEQGMLIAGENGEYRFAHGEVEWIV